MVVQEHRVRVTLLSRSTTYRRILNENEVCLELLCTFEYDIYYSFSYSATCKMQQASTLPLPTAFVCTRGSRLDPPKEISEGCWSSILHDVTVIQPVVSVSDCQCIKGNKDLTAIKTKDLTLKVKEWVKDSNLKPRT